MRDPEASELDRPLTLKQACEVIFDGAISVATLKAEHRRGNLELFKIGRAYFTTRRHVEAMIEKCKLHAPASGVKSNLSEQQSDETRSKAARAAALALAEHLIKKRRRS